MAGCSSQQHDFSWQNCEDFQLPENSVWFGKDDDGSDIFCGKAWCDGQEVPAKIIPDRRECRVNCNGSERVVPRCRKVLICRGNSDNRCDRRGNRDHWHRRRHHCHCRDDCSSESESEEETTSTTTTSSSKNESRLIIRSIKCSSTSSTTIVKKTKKEKKREQHHCWDERRTRMVPKVTVQPKVRYIPKVIMERTVRYEPETYVTKVCCDDRCGNRCEPCGPCDSYDSCEDSCRQESKCKEAIICESASSKRDRCVRPTKCDPPSPQPKAKCW